MKTLFVLLIGSAAFAADIRLGWDASPTPGVQHYILYGSTNQLAYSNLITATLRIDQGTNLAASLNGLQDVRWWFTLTSVKDGLESTNTSNVLIVDPSAPPPVPPLPPGNLRKLP